MRHTKAEDKEAFDVLYRAILLIGGKTTRAIRDGEKGYKKAVKEIMEICHSIE